MLALILFVSLFPSLCFYLSLLHTHISSFTLTLSHQFFSLLLLPPSVLFPSGTLNTGWVLSVIYYCLINGFILLFIFLPFPSPSSLFKVLIPLACPLLSISELVDLALFLFKCIVIQSGNTRRQSSPLICLTPLFDCMSCPCRVSSSVRLFSQYVISADELEFLHIFIHRAW